MHVCENTTLGELKNICLKHQKQGRDCETCPVYRFCNYEMTTSYPSGWKFKDKEENNEIGVE